MACFTVMNDAERLRALLPFGQDATITGVGTVTAIFSQNYVDALGMGSRQPVIIVRDTDVPTVTVGTAVTVNSTSYTIAQPPVDGTCGFKVIVLRAVA